MSEPSERIHAALRRFKAARAAAGGQHVESTEPEGTAQAFVVPGQAFVVPGQPFVVVDEQNLAALFSSDKSLLDDSRPYREIPARKLAATNRR